jgi:ribosomal-protein-serine acetyltransferase
MMMDQAERIIREELTDGRVRIARYRAEDAERVYAAIDASRAELAPWMFWLGPHYSFEDCKVFAASHDEAWAKADRYVFLIEEAGGEVRGSCGLSAIDRIHRRANLGYWVDSRHTGRGLATAAARLLARFALEDLRLERVEIIVAVENLASLRVARKLGAREEGVLYRRLRLQERMHDAVSFGLIRED